MFWVKKEIPVAFKKLFLGVKQGVRVSFLLQQCKAATKLSTPD